MVHQTVTGLALSFSSGFGRWAYTSCDGVPSSCTACAAAAATPLAFSATGAAYTITSDVLPAACSMTAIQAWFTFLFRQQQLTTYRVSQSRHQCYVQTKGCIALHQLEQPDCSNALLREQK